MSHYLGIEIGGTKLQLGVGDGCGPRLTSFARREIDPRRGAEGILTQIEEVGVALIRKTDVAAIGVGFGGPIDSQRGIVTKSHQVAGWEGFPLAEWCAERFGRPVVIGNDCDSAALAEAQCGAGEGADRVFYVTVGTGVGGGFVVGGRLEGRGRPAIAEIGHLRPGLARSRHDATVESIASGWGIEATTRRRVALSMQSPEAPQGEDRSAATDLSRRLEWLTATGQRDEADLIRRCDGDLEALTAESVAAAAADGNVIARRALLRATTCLGWAIAQVITLLAPHVVVIGGGVSLMKAALFLDPVRRHVDRYVFPPLANSYTIRPAALGEEVVVHGAVRLARASSG
jgi:glucokinase